MEGVQRELLLKEKYKDAIAHYRDMTGDLVANHGNPEHWEGVCHPNPERVFHPGHYQLARSKVVSGTCDDVVGSRKGINFLNSYHL